MNLQELKNRTILLFGKPRAFSKDEFDSQLKFHHINIVTEMSDSVILSVDGRMMTPYEQNMSEALYEKKFPSISIDVLEEELVNVIDSNTLLMSLKLSHDKERLKSFIQNSMIDDALFFRLLKIYSWSGEDFFENDDNRDVSAAFISRFYENIERNHNVQYATTGFIHLVAQTKNRELLDAISRLEPMKLHPKIKTAIAMSSYIDAKMQKRFAKEKGERVLEALSCNENLIAPLVSEFLKDELLSSNVAQHIKLNEELFTLLQGELSNLAKNESLTLTMQEKLLSHEEESVHLSLAQNNSIDSIIVEKLFQNASEVIKLALYENSATPKNILQIAYKNAHYHEALSKNENTPIDILYQLQLDSRYERYVKTNAGFAKHIQSENIGWMVS